MAVADTAAELDSQIDRGADRPDRCAVHRAAGKGAVEVDDVQPLEPLVLEGLGLRRRVVIVDGRGGHIAVLEPHAFAVLEVDGGKQDHGQAPSTIAKCPVDAARLCFSAL